MPAASSMIRTVPGGNVWPAGGPGTNEDDGGVGPEATSRGVPPEPSTSAATTATMSPTIDRPTIQAVRLLPSEAGGSTGTGCGSGLRGGARTGDDWTATPGPAGVVTSDQLPPSHHRTWPAAPSGSGYHPGGGAGGPDPVTAPP